MNPRVVTAAIEVVIDELFEELSAKELGTAVQKQIREGLAETLSKGVVAAIINLKGTRYISQVGAHCSDSAELIERLVARDVEVSERALTALGQVRNEILTEISNRIAAAVEAGVA